MNRIDGKFEELKKNGKKAFIAFIEAGDPSLEITGELVLALEESGVDIIELGIPFSDPMADGVVNQKAADRALKGGTTLKKIVSAVERIRQKTNIPIVLFTYLNPVFKYGWDKFVKDIKNAGIDGVLVLDLPVEESKAERALLLEKGIKIIYLLAPTSTDDRVKLVCDNASGFIYYVSRTGVTGQKESVEQSVKPSVEKIKKYTDVPVAVGFGVSRPEHVKEIGKYADGVVVGSAIVSKVEENIGKSGLVSNVSRFVKTLTNVL
jgi:tryptophan synthase alpha chain